MSNLRDYSHYVSDCLAGISDSDVGQQLPVASRERLTEAKRLADQLSEMLDRINAEVVSLEQAPNESSQAMQTFWDALPAGVLREKSPQLQELRERSEMLTQLYRAGIDVVEIHKLSAKEIDISRRIGDAFGQFHRIWDRFKLAISKGGSEIETRVGFSHEALRFFTILRDTGVVSSFQTEWYTFSDKTWRDIPVAKLRRLTKQGNPVRFHFQFDSAYRGLITGHWFNGYACDALEDQLRRLEVDYEVYPLLKYTCRGSTALTRGEFDILARIGPQRLVFECKSGRLSGAHDNFPALIAHEKALEEIFRGSRLEKAWSILIYNSFLTERAEVDQALAGTDIRAIPISDMRGQIIDLVNELSAG
jgi:hypothetical protein